MASANQPPVKTLGAFAANKTTSTNKNAPPNNMTQRFFQRHSPRATTANSIVVIAINPVTAMPYALAKLVDVGNNNTVKRQPTNINPFTYGM